MKTLYESILDNDLLNKADAKGEQYLEDIKLAAIGQIAYHNVIEKVFNKIEYTINSKELSLWQAQETRMDLRNKLRKILDAYIDDPSYLWSCIKGQWTFRVDDVNGSQHFIKAGHNYITAIVKIKDDIVSFRKIRNKIMTYLFHGMTVIPDINGWMNTSGNHDVKTHAAELQKQIESKFKIK